MYVWFMYVCLRHTYIHAQTYTLKHTRLRPSNIHAWGLQTYIHTRSRNSNIHTRSRNSNIHAYIHAWAIQTYIHTCLRASPKYPPSHKTKKVNRNAPGERFPKGFWTPNFFVKLDIHSYTLEGFKHTRLRPSNIHAWWLVWNPWQAEGF